MRCRVCSKSFSAARGQPSPGGSSAPGQLLVVTVLALALAGVLFVLGVAYAPWACVGIAAFVGLQVLVAWSDCRNGGTCPKCGATNPVRPWSF